MRRANLRRQEWPKWIDGGLGSRTTRKEGYKWSEVI